jgi:hypothetical protein
MRYFPVLALLLCGCSPNTSEEFEREGEARCRSLASVLARIESREQLVHAEPELKKHFESLIDLMIEARQFQQKHPDDLSSDGACRENVTNQLLEEQLRRIYCLEGGRELVERAQHEPLVRLDAYERTVAKRLERINPHH